MAITSGPFLSLRASGTVAKTLTSQTWKGIRVMRLKPAPIDAATAPQLAQRARVVSASNFILSPVLLPTVRPAWDLAVKQTREQITGFNLASRALIGIQKASATPYAVTGIAYWRTDHDDLRIGFSLRTVETLARYYPTVVSFWMHWGLTPSLELPPLLPTIEGGLSFALCPTNFDTGYPAGTKLYTQLRDTQGGFETPISGINQFTTT